MWSAYAPGTNPSGGAGTDTAPANSPASGPPEKTAGEFVETAASVPSRARSLPAAASTDHARVFQRTSPFFANRTVPAGAVPSAPAARRSAARASARDRPLSPVQASIADGSGNSCRSLLRRRSSDCAERASPEGPGPGPAKSGEAKSPEISAPVGARPRRNVAPASETAAPTRGATPFVGIPMRTGKSHE